MSDETVPPSAAPASILLADDDPGLLAALAIALRAAGHRVTTAPDGTSALEQVDGERFDLLVLDVLMPGGTGWEVHARSIERAGKDRRPRAILMTGFNQEYVVDIAVLRREGVSTMLLKPFPPATLVEEVARVLAAPLPHIPRSLEQTRP